MAKDWKAEWEALAKESRKLAKRANQRLVRLEHYSVTKPSMKKIIHYAYKNASKYIEKNLGVGKSGKPRFKENVKLYDISDGTKQLTGQALYKANVQIQRQRIKAMNEFLSSESSTLGESRVGPKTKGIKAIYDQKTNTINERYLSQYGLQLSENDLKRYFESKKQAKLESEVGSEQMFIVAAVMKKFNLKSNKRDLEKFVKSHIDLSEYDGNMSDLSSRKGESYKDYLDRVGEYIDFTGDEVLNDMVIKALKSGINSGNIFI